ncbi:MAG: hypothetical protein ABGW77_06960 [Campylobacterales bacterium]
MRVGFGVLPLAQLEGVDRYLHPVRYRNITITYEPMGEEAVVALLTYWLLEGREGLPEEVRDFFEQLDEGYLSSESNFDQWDFEELEIGELVVGRDILRHPRVENIKRFLALLRDFGGVKVEGIELPLPITPSDPELGEIFEAERSFEYNLEEVAELPSFDEGVVYCCENGGIVKPGVLLCSHQFIIANKIKRFKVAIDGEIFRVEKVPDLKGVFGVIYRPVEGYPFKRVKIENWEE